jgi:hypothetical protein
MNIQTRSLRRILAIDSIGTTALALCAVFAARPLATLFGIPVFTLTSVGLLLLPFTAWVGWLARQANPPRKLVWWVIAANAVWIVDSLLLLLSGWLPLTELGAEFIAVQALLALGITIRQYVAIRRVTRYTHATT